MHGGDSVFNEKLLDFLQNIDTDFNPPLSSKVYLPDYVKKITDKADLVLDYDGNEISGLVVVYCNEMVNKKAYIPLVGVSSKYRNRGIARKLMIQAIRLVKEKGFKIVGIHSNNPVAIKLYESLGFSTIVQGERSYLELSL